MSSWLRAPRPHYRVGETTRTLLIAGFVIAVILRFSFGYPMDGRRVTDATFWRRGNRPFDEREAVSFWAFLPYYQRMLIRWACVFEALGAGHWWLSGSLWTGLPVLLAALVATGFGCYKLGGRVAEFNHRRKLIGPMARALAPLLGTHEKAPGDLVRIPRSYVKVHKGMIGTVSPLRTTSPRCPPSARR